MPLMISPVVCSPRAAACSSAMGRGAVVACALWVTLFSLGSDHSALAAPPPVKEAPLDHNDQESIRRIIYGGGKRIAHPLRDDGLPGHAVLVVPNELAAVFKKNPVETLLLLRKIVEGGRPRDALLAGGYVI